MANKKKTVKCSECGLTCKHAYTMVKGKASVKTYMGCQYIIDTSHRRGCDPEKCDKYEKLENDGITRKKLFLL